MSASIQNNIRLRIFLILVLSIIIRITRTQASTSVHKASGILETNYFIYGLVMICSLLPFKSSWVVAFCGQIVATILNISALSLALIATWRCKDQVGCVQTMPFSIVVLFFTLLVAIFDTLQTWSIYQILSGPMIITSAPQRTRILFAWAFPFAYLINFTLMFNSQWTPLVTPHLVGDTLIILMANSGESVILITVMMTLVVFDVLAAMAIIDSLVLKAIYVQIALTLGGIFIYFGAVQMKQKDLEYTESTVPIKMEQQDFEYAGSKMSGPTLVKRNKKKSKKLHF
tara:strand:+ start:22161 stop:23018 length:858 start_codon:yes stop_codon:yes gene_type:complete